MATIHKSDPTRAPFDSIDTASLESITKENLKA